MVDQELMAKLRRVFSFTLENPAILGVILYGSYATGEETIRSDIDICIVAPDLQSYEAWSWVCRRLGGEAEDALDIRVFGELPLHVQGDILDKGIVIVSPDIPALYERLFPTRKRWEDFKFKLKCCAN